MNNFFFKICSQLTSNDFTYRQIIISKIVCLFMTEKKKKKKKKKKTYRTASILFCFETDVVFLDALLLKTNIQLFHAYLGNRQNCCPEVPRTARCTIARGRKAESSGTPSCPRYRGAVVLSIPPNSHEITVLLPNQCWKSQCFQLNWHATSTHTTYLVAFDVILVMFDVINQATDKTIARCFSIYV